MDVAPMPRAPGSDPVEPARLVNARRFLMGISTGHADAVLALLAPTVVYTVSGHSPLAGTVHGPVEVQEHVRRVFRATSGTIDVLKWDDWLVGQNHVAALQFAQAQGAGMVHRNHLVFLIETDRHDLLTNIQLLFGNQDEADRFLARLPVE